MRIILAANDTTFIYNLRREILKGLIAEGHEVSVMCQVLQFKDELEQMGCGVIDIETARQRTHLRTLSSSENTIRR